MRKITANCVVVLLVLFLSAGLGLAGNGKSYGGNGDSGTGGDGGNCQGTGLSLICAGEPLTFEGTVSQECYPGSGLGIDTGSEIVVVFGIGPYWYWEENNTDRPGIGDEVTVEGMKVTFSDGSTKIIAIGITVNGEELQLREECIDGVGGWPLWRHGR